MTNTTNTHTTNCPHCGGFGHVDSGCDDQTQMTCFACGGTGTVSIDDITPSTDGIKAAFEDGGRKVVVDTIAEAIEASDDASKAAWCVATYPKTVQSNHAAWARFASFDSKADADAYADTFIESCDHAEVMPAADVDAWVADNSAYDKNDWIDDYEDDILTEMGR